MYPVLTNAERSWVRLTELQWIAVNQVFTDRWQIFLCAKIAGSFELREVRLTGVDGQELVYLSSLRTKFSTLFYG